MSFFLFTLQDYNCGVFLNVSGSKYGEHKHIPLIMSQLIGILQNCLKFVSFDIVISVQSQLFWMTHLQRIMTDRTMMNKCKCSYYTVNRLYQQ